jgi:opacity protein-like surface antigen
MFFAISVSAQQLKLNKGDFEIATSGMFNRAEFSGDFRFGAFIADYVQLGLDIGYVDTDFFTRYSLGAYIMGLVETRTYFLPYYGLGLAFSSLEPAIEGSRSSSGLDFKLFGGVKYYVADNVSLNTELGVGFSTENTYIKDSSTTSSDISLRVGLSYLW